MNKKLMIAVGVAGLAVAAFAGPKGGTGGGPRPNGGGPRPSMRQGSGGKPAGRPAPAPRPAPRDHHSGWGRGGREFWPGFAGGIVGGLVSGVVSTPPRTVTTVVTTPTVVTPAPTVVVTPAPTVAAPVVQNVWVNGRYIDQVQPDGSVIRIWQPGHYESRTVVP